MSMITRRASLVVAALLAGVAGRASAAAGNGIRLGGSEGRLHPYLEVEDRYDSNVYYTATGDQVGDMVLHVRPGFELSVPGETTAAELAGSLDWAQYLGLSNTETRSQLSKLYGQAALGVSVNRRGMVGLELDDEFRRAQGSSALTLTNAVISNYNALRVKVPYRPGGGALTLALNGSWALETFEAFYTGAICDPAIAGCQVDYAKLGYNEYRAGAEGKWRFLPRTALVVGGGWFSRVPNDSAISSVGGYEAAAGFTGLVTPHVGATLKGGYTSTTGVAAGNVGTFIAAIEGEWIATDSASVRVGWAHGLGIDPGPSLYKSNRVYAGGRILLGGRYAVRTDVTWETRDYEVFTVVTGTTAGSGAGTGSGTVLRIEPALEAGITRWMSGSVGYAYSKRSSTLPAGAVNVPGFDYAKNEVWIRAAVRY